jgi:lysophospholipase L1-like esterase
VALGALALAHAAGASEPAHPKSHWVPTWFAAPSAEIPHPTDDQTLRMVVTPRVGGRKLRVEVTNRYSATPTRLVDVTVGRELAGATVDASSLRRVTFDGHRRVTLAPGEDRWSDPLTLRIHGGERVAISAYLPGHQSPTIHFDAEQVSYTSGDGTGDFAMTPGSPPFTEETQSWIAVEAVDVRRPHPGPTVVTLGDSLTDGLRSGDGAEARYPDVLAGRDVAKRSDALIVNAGVTNDVLRRKSALGGGTSAVARLKADALEQPNLRAVVVEDGMNDLRGNPELTGRTMITAYSGLIHTLRRHHVRFMLATLTPTGGDPFTGGWVEPRRERINAWIRRLPMRERVDFDRILRDPAEPLRLRPAYDSGDHLHPNAAGYAVMARGVRLNRLVGHG